MRDASRMFHGRESLHQTLHRAPNVVFATPRYGTHTHAHTYYTYATCTYSSAVSCTKNAVIYSQKGRGANVHIVLLLVCCT